MPKPWNGRNCTLPAGSGGCTSELRWRHGGKRQARGNAVYQELRIFSGNAHPALTQAICDYLGLPLGQMYVGKFSNDNIFVKVEENVRNRDIFIVQPAAYPVNDNLMELFIMIDAFKRASA